MTRRAYISFKTKYAAALRIIGGIPYLHAKAMHEDQLISLFDYHHDIQHGLKPNDPMINHHSNGTPMLRPEHKARFARDNAAVKKVTRLNRASDAAVNRLLAKQAGAPLERTSRWPSRKIQSRGFQRGRS